MSYCLYLGGVQPNVRDGYEEHHDQPVCPNCMTPDPLALHADGKCERCDPGVADCICYLITAGYDTAEMLAAARWYRESHPDGTAQELKSLMDDQPGHVKNCIRDTDRIEADALLRRLRDTVPKLSAPTNREVALFALSRLLLCHANHLELLYSAWEWEPPQEPEARGEFLGAVDSRVELLLTCKKIIDLGVGDYGQKFLAILEDANGHKAKWFTGENLWMEEGFEYLVRGTVKAHEVYNGERQTVLTRCKEKT